MSIESTASAPARLLPAAVESSVRDWAMRAIGCLLVGFAVLSWIALLSWTVSDPSLTQATAKPVRNLLGPLGAAASDLMIQTLGAAVVFVLIGPMIWGLELLAGARPIKRFGVKLLAFPLAVLALAGALSGLPTFSVWPLHNGFGGMLGDIIYNMSVMAMLGVSVERGSSVAGSGLGGIGICLLLHSLGFRLDSLASLLLGRAAPAGSPASSKAATVSASDDRAQPVLPMPAASASELMGLHTPPAPAIHQTVYQTVHRAAATAAAEPATRTETTGAAVITTSGGAAGASAALSRASCARFCGSGNN